MKQELFDEFENEWQKEWKDMPEFVQFSKEKPYAQITVRFATKEDLNEFAKIIGQKLTNKTKAIWHPAIERGLNANKIYVDES